MGYPYPQQSNTARRIRGIIMLMVSVVVIAMVAYLGFIVDGGVFSQFDNLKGGLSSPALAVYNFANLVTSNIFLVIVAVVIIAAVGKMFAAMIGAYLHGGEF